MTMTNITTPTVELWRLSRVIAVTGRSRSRIYDDPTFPRPLKISRRCSAWRSDEIAAWIDARTAERDAALAARAA